MYELGKERQQIMIFLFNWILTSSTHLSSDVKNQEILKSVDEAAVDYLR